MIDTKELEKYPVSDFSAFKKTEAFYKGTCAIESFITAVVIKVLDNQIKLNDKEKAVIEIFYRMYFWLKSTIALNQTIHFQAVASAARSIYELTLDENMLVSDLISDGTEKYRAFTKIERYRAAKKIVEYKDRYPDSSLKDKAQRDFLNLPNKHAEIENSIVKYWGRDRNGNPKDIKHWSEMNALDRAKKIDKDAKNRSVNYEEMYISDYPMLSWYIHSGSAGIENITPDACDSIIGFSHSIIQACFLEATRIIGIFMHLHQVMDNFFKIINQLKFEPGEFLFEEQIRLLKKAETDSLENSLKE